MSTSTTTLLISSVLILSGVVMMMATRTQKSAYRFLIFLYTYVTIITGAVLVFMVLFGFIK